MTIRLTTELAKRLENISGLRPGITEVKVWTLAAKRWEKAGMVNAVIKQLMNLKPKTFNT